MGRSIVGRDQWLAWVAEQAESGLSVQQFCTERQISVASFYGWRRKVLGKQDSRSAAFVSVLVAREPSRLEIELPCGAMLRVPHDDNALRQVLRVLLELGQTS